MALSNLFGWNKKDDTAPAAACGTACGSGDKPSEAPAACGASDKPAACGASDTPAKKPSACGSACGAGDKK